jgi:thioredoxin 1
MSLATCSQNYKFDALLTDEGLVVIDATTSYCDPYRTSSAAIVRLAEDYSGCARAVKLDIERSYSLAKTLNSHTSPSILIFKGGQLLETLPIFTAYERIKEAVDLHNRSQFCINIQLRRNFLQALRYQVS